MIQDPIVPEPVGATLVGTHAGPDLIGAGPVLKSLRLPLGEGPEPVQERLARLAQALLPLPALGRHHDAGRQVPEPGGVLVLVTVLTARP